ncbi:MAG TPA: serine hydrolase [Gemmatimonadales bacterium]|nr:serine hydrolase [Gemmatimonadales bacterium]
MATAPLHRLLAICATLTAAAAPLPAQGLPKDFDAYVTKAMQSFAVPGLAIAVVKDGKVVLAKGYGVRRLGDPTPVDAHTLFQIASNTKAYTTAALAMLADSGRLQLDDPVQKYIPEFQLWDPWVTREFTIRDALTHRSGLGLGAGDLLWFHSTYTSTDMIRRFRYLKPVSSFRSQYAYDNVLYMVAGQVVAAATGKPWADFIRTRIFTPLGMSEALTSISEVPAGANIAAPHAKVDGVLQVVPYDTSDNIQAAGMITENVSDAAKWLLVQLDSGRYSGGRLWSAKQAREMWSAQTITGVGNPPPPLAGLRANFGAYGLGWGLRDYHGHKLVSHTGGLDGMTSQTMLVPDQRLGLVVFTNAETPIFAALGYRIVDAFLGVPPTDWAAAFKEVSGGATARADSVLRSQDSSRARGTSPSLPLAGYAGRYTDAWYGDATITQEGDHLVLRFSASPAFVGDLEHWHHDVFVAHWRQRNIPDAFVYFALKPDGAIEQFKMEARSPLADFSFDYQDLLFTPAR